MSIYSRFRIFYENKNHAPSGGLTIGGTRFAPGEFIPAHQWAQHEEDQEIARAKQSRAAVKTARTPGRTSTTIPAKRSLDSTSRSLGKSGQVSPGSMLASFQNASKSKSHFKKKAAVVGELVSAQRVGVGKDAKIILDNGQEAPSHIKPSMIPPGWTDVMVSTDPQSDVIAKGKDELGRSQTRYTANFATRNAAVKFSKIKEMLNKSELIEHQVHKDLSSKDSFTREAAELTWLIMTQATRPGSNKETGGKAKAYGATTLLSDHVVQAPDGVRLQFIGKKGVPHDHLIKDKDLAAMLVRRKQESGPGQQLFHVDADDLNRKYINALDGGGFSAKDFRTLRATKLAIAKVREMGDCCKSMKDYKQRVKEVAEHVSHTLGNRPAECLKSYIAPEVFTAWRV